MTNNEITIKELKNPTKLQLDRISKLHILAFPGFFLTQLGYSFLKTLYTGYFEDEESGIIVAEKEEEIIGFIAYSKDYPKFYKGLIKKHLLRFAICSAGASIKHPSFIKRLLGAFGKSDSVVKKEKYVELSSICVDPAVEGCGVGSRLIEFLKNSVDFNTYAYINLETDAEDNDAANHFYKKNAFRLARTFVTDEGRKMNEYRFGETLQI